MGLVYRENNSCKYNDIKRSKWSQDLSQNRVVQVTTPQSPQNLKRRKVLNLNLENQLYRKKRLKSESSV